MSACSSSVSPQNPLMKSDDSDTPGMRVRARSTCACMPADSSGVTQHSFVQMRWESKPTTDQSEVGLPSVAPPHAVQDAGATALCGQVQRLADVGALRDQLQQRGREVLGVWRREPVEVVSHAPELDMNISDSLPSPCCLAAPCSQIHHAWPITAGSLTGCACRGRPATPRAAGRRIGGPAHPGCGTYC